MPPRRSSARQNATPTVAGASSEPLGGANGWSGLQAPVAVMGTQNPGAAILQEQQAAGQSGSLETPSETQALSSTSSAPPRRTSRFKPKATPRQSQQERERLERIERVRVTQAAVKKATEERRAQRAQASQPAHRGGAKSSVFRGRGSGTFVGREANRSSGPFGGGYVLSKSRGSLKTAADTVLSGHNDAGVHLSLNAPVEEKKPFIKRRDSIGIVNKRKLAPRSSSGLDQKIKEELDETIFLSSDDEDDKVHGQRINIEFINLDSDEEDGDGPHNSLRPVFVERREHVDRSVEVKLQTSLAHAEEAKRQAERKTEEMQADSLFFSDDDDHSPERRRPRKTKDFEILGSHRRWRGMYEDEDGMHADGVVIKDEPQSETEPSKRKSAVDVRSADESLIDGTGTKKEPKTPRLRKALNLKSPQLWKQTKEDGEEWDRIKQAEELVKSQLTDPSILFRPQGRDPMDGLAATNPNSALSYIFQFPPVLPLLEVARETRDGKLKAKTVVIDEEKIPETKLKLPTGRKSEAQEIKPPLFLSPTMRTPSERYPPGKVGKLVVHESGATYLHWGTGPTASVLELKNGHALGFRMDLVMAEQGFADQEAAVGDQDVIKDEMEPEPRTDPRTLPLKGEADDVLPAGERMDLDEENTDGKKGADGNKAGQRETIAKEEDGLDDDSFEEVILGGAPQTLRRGGACSLGPIVGRFTLMPDWERLLGSL